MERGQAKGRDTTGKFIICFQLKYILSFQSFLLRLWFSHNLSALSENMKKRAFLTFWLYRHKESYLVCQKIDTHPEPKAGFLNIEQYVLLFRAQLKCKKSNAGSKLNKAF